MRIVVIATLALLLGACASTSLNNSTTTVADFLPYSPADERPAPNDSPRILAIFFDGTGNVQLARSNLAQLYQLVANQNRPDIVTFYTEGVGTDNGVLGLGLGTGIGTDIKEAYRFLAERYRGPQDSIYLFGWSRGAYSARALAGMLFAAGLPRLPRTYSAERHYSDEQLIWLIDDLYDAYKTTRGTAIERQSQRLAEIDGVYGNWRVEQHGDVRVRFMGLWDTVEALGRPDYRFRVYEPDLRYLDQICNIDRASHALALDDNRARIYTPILMTGDAQIRFCDDVSIDQRVNEVWFSGAHSDVGGGNRDGYLPGVSMNWMLSQLAEASAARDENLLPAGAAVFENRFDVVHDAERRNLVFRGVFGRYLREPHEYARRASYNRSGPDGNPRIRVHESVRDRLARIRLVEQRHHAGCSSDLPDNEYAVLCSNALLDQLFYRWLRAGSCLVENAARDGFDLVGDCVDIVGNSPPASANDRQP